MAIFARICYCDHCPTDGHNSLSKINNSLLKSGFLSLSIHLLIFIQFRVMVRLESIPAVIGWEVWYTLDRLSVCCRVREAIKLAVLTLANGTVKQKMCQIHQHKPAGSASLDFWNLTRRAAAARLKTWVFTAVSVFTAVLMIHGYRSSEFETLSFCTHASLKQRKMSHQFQKMKLFGTKFWKTFKISLISFPLFLCSKFHLAHKIVQIFFFNIFVNEKYTLNIHCEKRWLSCVFIYSLYHRKITEAEPKCLRVGHVYIQGGQKTQNTWTKTQRCLLLC